MCTYSIQNSHRNNERKGQQKDHFAPYDAYLRAWGIGADGQVPVKGYGAEWKF